MSKYSLVFLLVLATRSLLADDFKTIDGKEYKNVTVSRVEPDGLVLTSSSGISKVYFTELPKDVQERYNYDATKGAAYSAQQAATQGAFQKQQQELRQKLADQNNRYWIEKEYARESANDQASSGIQVTWATYGSGSDDRDVRERLQFLVEHPHPNMRIGASLLLLPTESVSTVNNTLFVIFTYNGVYYQTELRDGEPLSFANVRPAQATPEEAANAYHLWSDLLVGAMTGSRCSRQDAALSARLGNTPTWRHIRAELKADIKSMKEEGKQFDKWQANVENAERSRRDSALQAQATANYEAKEKNRMATLDQRKALTGEIQRLDSQRQRIESNNQNTRDITREIDTKQKILNSLGGQF